jgi:hypothetical protein
MPKFEVSADARNVEASGGGDRPFVVIALEMIRRIDVVAVIHEAARSTAAAAFFGFLCQFPAGAWIGVGNRLKRRLYRR